MKLPFRSLLVGLFAISLVTLSILIFSSTQAASSQPITLSGSANVPGSANTSDSGSNTAATGNNSKASIDENDITRFTNSIVLIKDFYVQPISDNKLLENAIRGMVSGLDPHSEYLDADSYKTLLMTTEGAFGGVGIEVTPEYGVLKIVSPMDDTPAARAKIKPGDYIVAIDGKLVSEMSLQDAVDKMRGKPGSLVNLTVLRKGEKTPLVFKLTREIIRIPSIKSKMLDDNFGYVRISQFQEPTAKLMRDAIHALFTQSNNNLRGLVLDLRNNPGGLLETAVSVTDAFLDSNTLHNKYNDIIVYTDGRLPEAKYSAKATGSDILNNLPMVVLINNGSASASEIVAGALQDYHRAIIVGMPSFGKGSVQTVLPLDKNHAIKLTTALYHTPSGRVIQNIGIIPDIQIEDLKVSNKITDEDFAMIEPIKEFQLRNHITTNGSGENAGLGTDTKDIALAQEDFQLFEALKILRTMAFTETKTN